VRGRDAAFLRIITIIITHSASGVFKQKAINVAHLSQHFAHARTEGVGPIYSALKFMGDNTLQKHHLAGDKYCSKKLTRTCSITRVAILICCP
jgi:hypothetical protein